MLGDIPILGSLFRSKEIRQNRSELLVLVTPYIVLPSDEMPAVPPGEPETWNWERHLDGPVPLPEDEGRIRQRENEERVRAERGDGDMSSDDGAMSDDGAVDDNDEL